MNPKTYLQLVTLSIFCLFSCSKGKSTPYQIPIPLRFGDPLQFLTVEQKSNLETASVSGAEDLLNAKKVRIFNVESLRGRGIPQFLSGEIKNIQSKDLYALDLLNLALYLNPNNTKAKVYIALLKSTELIERINPESKHPINTQLSLALQALELNRVIPEFAKLPESYEEVLKWIAPQEKLQEINTLFLVPAVKLIQPNMSNFDFSEKECDVYKSESETVIDCKVIERITSDSVVRALGTLSNYLSLFSNWKGSNHFAIVSKWYKKTIEERVPSGRYLRDNEAIQMIDSFPEMFTVNKPVLMENVFKNYEEVLDSSERYIQHNLQICKSQTRILGSFCIWKKVVQQISFELQYTQAPQFTKIIKNGVIQLNMFPIFDGDLSDLKTLIPRTYDGDGNIEIEDSFDYTLQGLFPVGLESLF